jgi:hypothetical protein
VLLGTKVGFFFALVLIVAVASILITPDPTDDVDAIVHLRKVVYDQALTHVPVPDVALIVRARGPLYVVVSSNVTSRVLDLLCTCRC